MLNKIKLMLETKNNKNSVVKKSLISLSVVLVIGLFFNFVLIKKGDLKLKTYIKKMVETIIPSVSAEEMYSMFICPCCGREIGVDCCGMAKERMVYIEALVEGKLSEKKIISTYVEKYGLNSFKSEEQKLEFKEDLIKKAPSKRPIISINTENYDFGDVSQAKGVVNTLFEITNTGKKDLIINKLETSCGCTSASIVYKDNEGPIFSMPGHGDDSPTDWEVTIPKGEKAYIKVYYDPDVHTDFRGTAIREIHVFSNDPIDFEIKVEIELNQTD